jgi:L-fuculose-phosphate aldolase
MPTDRELKQQLADITTELYHLGYVTASGGNLSCRSVERENAVWITPSQIFKGGLKPQQMVLIDLEGSPLENSLKPSVEHIYHSGVMRMRPKVNAVIHTHAPSATVFGMSDLEMIPITTEAIIIKNMPRVPFHLGGTKELAQDVMELVGKAPVVGAYLRNHGLVTVGPDLRKAADMTLMVEHTCEIVLKVRSTGIEPSFIPQETIDYLGQLIARHAAL